MNQLDRIRSGLDCKGVRRPIEDAASAETGRALDRNAVASVG